MCVCAAASRRSTWYTGEERTKRKSPEAEKIMKKSPAAARASGDFCCGTAYFGHIPYQIFTIDIRIVAHAVI